MTAHSHDADRVVLADFLHHAPETCDAAARRLTRSPHADGRRMAAEWKRLRATRCVRIPEPAGETSAG